jgi:predicted DNA-binding transcriptional regulator AlpA
VKDGTIPAPLKICGMTRWREIDIAALMQAPSKPQPRDRKRPHYS